MRVRLLTLRFSPSLGVFDDRPLVEFLADKQLLSFTEHFFTFDDVPHVLCTLRYDAGSTSGLKTAPASSHRPAAPPARATAPSDPLADLDEAQRTLFQALREWRAAKSRDEGVPPYLVFTNRELRELVRSRPDTRTALSQIDGIGKSKVERYGDDVLRLVCPRPAEVGVAATATVATGGEAAL